MTTDDRTPGQVAFEAWMLATGRTDAKWQAMSDVIRAAWEMSARAVLEHDDDFEEVEGA